MLKKKCIILNRSDINTDEIIPAKYLTENDKISLKPHILEDLEIEGFDSKSADWFEHGAIMTLGNFGCGSSREHAVWVFEVNDIDTVIAPSFARIFRQNMINCGMLPLELPEEVIAEFIVSSCQGLPISIVGVDLDNQEVEISDSNVSKTFSFEINSFDKEVLLAGGWLAYADANF
jgi:3-isopropylmalate/(R)-2-methylmalate dehydratase small subunit